MSVQQNSQLKTLTINIFHIKNSQFNTLNSALTNTHSYIIPISMNIVITDGFTLHSNDLAWDCFKSLGKVTFYERTPISEIVERCKEADIVITNKTPFSAETIAALPQLKMIAVAATGYNIIDTQASAAQGIVVSNIPAYGTASVAQHIFALILELSNHVGKNSQAVANGAWVSAQDWCFSLSPIIELAGKTLGIVGMGRIGQQTAKIAEAFGMKVCYASRTVKEELPYSAVPHETLFSESDFIALCCPSTPENIGFVNKELLAKMKRTAYLVNASRGQLIHEKDLAEALKEGVLAGAALDVLSQEPPSESNPLLTAPNCLITPHNAWISFEARQRIVEMLMANIQGFINGAPQNVV